MPTLPFTTLDVFTTTRYAGNPLAIVRIPPNHTLPTSQMQTIAREFNLSETLFIHENAPQLQTPSDGDPNKETTPEWRVRIFLTNVEVPFAGHPTIGAACYAMSNLAPPGAKKGRLVCNAGPIELAYAPSPSPSPSSSGGVAQATIPQNFHRHTEALFTPEQVYELQPALLHDSATAVAKVAQEDIAVLSPVKGMNFVCVRLPSVEMLAQMRTSGAHPEPVLDEGWRGGFAGSYFYVLMGSEQGDGIVRVRTRMIEGTLEDPATGSAACALCMYLALLRPEKRRAEFEVTQGVEMGRRSEIGVVVETRRSSEGEDAATVVEQIYLSGSAVKVMKGVIDY